MNRRRQRAAARARQSRAESEHADPASDETATEPRDRTAAARPGSPGTLQALSQMIKELEGQLDRVLAMNGALEEDLQVERKRRVELERRVTDLTARLQRAEREAGGKEDLLTEIDRLNSERSALGRTIAGLRAELSEAAEKRARHVAEVARLRAGRSDALEEVQSVEAQFARAMQMVADLRTRLAVLVEEHDALRERHRKAEEAHRETAMERDSLLAEVEESRAALEDIRRSLVDACMMTRDRE